MNHEVFISYSSKNQNAADAICHILEENGIKCWMAPRNIPAGTEYGDLIDKAIKYSDVVVVVFSQNAAESQWVKGELNIAFEEQKTIIPYRIDSTPFSGQNRVILNQKHWIDAYPDYRTKFNDLVNAVLSALGRPVLTSKRTSDIPIRQLHKRVPYIGLLMAAVIVTIVVIIKTMWGGDAFSYKVNGLSVANVAHLTDAQRTAIMSIMDDMILVEGGTFIMGNNEAYPEYMTELDSLSANSHPVSVGSFYISKYEVSQRQWSAFAQVVGSVIELGDDKAVDNISWEDAKAFTDTLSGITGLKFSLPSEAQWEYAAGDGGASSRLPFAGFEDGIHHYAWTIADNLLSAADVGKKSPNKIGLYDMTGNVSEWCLDDYSLYSVAQVQDPVIQLDNNKKIYRGGDFRTPNIMDMKITTRYYAPPFAKRQATGLRLVINL